MAYQADRADPVPHLHGRDRLFPGFYAIEPVTMLVVALVEMNLVLPDFRDQYFRVTGIKGPRVCFPVNSVSMPHAVESK